MGLEDAFFFVVAQHLGRLYCVKKSDRFLLKESDKDKN